MRSATKRSKYPPPQILRLKQARCFVQTTPFSKKRLRSCLNLATNIWLGCAALPFGILTAYASLLQAEKDAAQPHRTDVWVAGDVGGEVGSVRVAIHRLSSENNPQTKSTAQAAAARPRRLWRRTGLCADASRTRHKGKLSPFPNTLCLQLSLRHTHPIYDATEMP